MNGSINHNSFIFSDQLNAETLIALYGDDYVYMEEVFGTVLKEYVVLTDNVIASYTSKNIPALKAAVHKMKPIFGFVGLNEVQEQCQSFENVCQSATSFELIDNDYGSLRNNLVNSKYLIEEEKKKLELFNSQKS
jgi:HPt (histidine-containing phosphotransfer) domain-containing protein